jgi:aminoglycoside phosphotransferase (APT) family kinase protein
MLRLGGDLALRMPRRVASALLILKEQALLSTLAPRLPLPIPAPLRTGQPSLGYPYAWSVTPFFEGDPADLAPPDQDQAEALAGFLKALHQPAPDEAPRNPYRGVPLSAPRRSRGVWPRPNARADRCQGACAEFGRKH